MFLKYEITVWPIQKNEYWEAELHQQAPMLPLVHLHVSHQFLLSLEETSTGTSTIIFVLWLVFPDWTETSLSLCSFSQILSFVTYGVFMIATCDSIFTTQTNHHCLLSKRTLDKQLLFCNGRRHSSFWFPHIFGEH